MQLKPLKHDTTCTVDLQHEETALTAKQQQQCSRSYSGMGPNTWVCASRALKQEHGWGVCRIPCIRPLRHCVHDARALPSSSRQGLLHMQSCQHLALSAETPRLPLQTLLPWRHVQCLPATKVLLNAYAMVQCHGPIKFSVRHTNVVGTPCPCNKME